MKEPDHKVKRHIVPFNNKEKPYWIENPVRGWLASGLYDRNGVEIFEGDIVQVETFEKGTATVVFRDGAFWLGNYLLGELPVIYYPTLEIVGHIAEEGNNHVDC